MAKMEEGNPRYQIGVDINSNTCGKEKKPEKEKIQIGTMRCLRPENEVTDVDAASTTSQSSKISDIMKCMFFRKKETEVVEMKTEKSSSSKKQSLTLDRSERSRRVLKMESMRAAPLEREAQPLDRPQTPPAAKRFLPSESPTAAFLAYVNPPNRQIRRAYSDAIKASGVPTDNKPHTREAFVQKQESQRNVNYRANRATERANSFKKAKEAEDINQNKDTVSSQKPKKNNRNNANMTVVPGTTMNVEEEMTYHANVEIKDLHDEIKRMNMGHSNFSNDQKGPPKRRRREGSISVSGSGSEDSEDDETTRPKNPEPEPDIDTLKHVKNRSMEEVIDGLYLKTQQKLKDIYQNGIGTLESYRPESSSEEPDMNKFERDLFSSDQPKDSGVETESSVDNADGNFSSQDELKATHQTGAVSKTILKESAKKNIENRDSFKSDGNPNMKENAIDGLLNEVSVWAKDRENWLLGRTELDNKYSENKETIRLSHKIDYHNGTRTKTDSVQNNDDEIDRVRASNEQRCNNWIEGKSNTPKCSQRTIDIITSPRIFSPRNNDNNSLNKANNKENPVCNDENEPVKIFSPRNGISIPSHVNNMDKLVNDKETSREPVPSKRSYKGVTVLDYSVSSEKVVDPNHNEQSSNATKKPVSILADKHNEHNKTMINGIVIPTPTFDTDTEDERSTICDDLSELDRAVPYRARSPDSWLSSCGSPTNLLRRPDTSDRDFNDSFETVSSLTADSVKVHRVSVAKAPETVNQTIRQKPQIHAPSRSLNREGTPMPNDAEHLPLPKSMMRNTQIQPMTSSSFRQERNKNQIQRLSSMNGINSLTGLPSMASNGILKGTRNLNDFELSMNLNTRPFSEIPLSSSDTSSGFHENTRLIGNSRKYHGGFQSNQTSEHDVINFRPASETLPAKRTDKVGMGHVMATDSTRERNRYAKDIVNSMDRKRQQPQKAFTKQEDNRAKPKENEASFLSQLLKGGYSYDKHSSRRINTSSETAMQSPREHTEPSNKTKSLSKGTGYGLENNSKSQSNVTSGVKETPVETHSSNAFNKPKKSNDLISPRLNGGYNNDYSSTPRTKGKGNPVFSDLELLSPRDSDLYDNTQVLDTRRKEKPTTSKNDAIEAISQANVPQARDVFRPNKTMEQISHGSVSTAEKFRKMRDRRNHDMQWLMKDAAETEV